MNNLPTGWAWTELAQICTSITDGDHQPPPQVPLGIPFLVIGNIRAQRLDFTDCRHVPPEYFESLNPVRRPQKDDVLYSLVGSYGISVLVKDDSPFCVQRHIGILRPSPEISSAFLALALSSRAVFDQATQYATGTAQLTVPLAGLRRIRVPLPPLLEQKRIVAAIEEQFSRLDAGVAALERARQNLKRMRGAVLHQIIGYGSGAKLPDGWEWVTIRDVAGDDPTPVLTGPFGTALSRSDFMAHGVPVLTIGCLTSDGIRIDGAPRVSNAKAETLHRYALIPGDVLFSRMATVGRAAVVGETEAGSLINYHLMRLRLDHSVILPEFLVLLCRGSRAIQQYLSDSNHGVTRPGINTKQLLGLPVALPPISEQRRIVSMARSADEVVSQLERQAALAMARARTLRSSILKTAFSGKLVPHDDDDEPASALLARIRAGRASSKGNKRIPTRKPRTPREKVVI